MNNELEQENDFVLCCRSKKGDTEALTVLWERYRNYMIRIFSVFSLYHNLETSEIESESFILFSHKLDIFNPDKVKKEKSEWSFSYMLSGGVVNERDKLRNRKIKEWKNENTFNDIAEIKQEFWPAFLTMRYNPENLFSKNHLAEKKELFLKQLTDEQNSILQLRRKGVTVAGIADAMGCSVSKIRHRIYELKTQAKLIFEYTY